MVKKTNVIDTSKLVNKTDCNSKINDIEDIEEEVKGVISNISGLVTTAVLTAVENKITNVSELDKKIVIQNCQTLKINISPHLTVLNL